MASTIKTIEDLSLNAWPSHQIELYDGWILRFSYFYTHRTNSVEQLAPSTIPRFEKISYCEQIYRKWGTPCIFKITPLLDPDFDRILEKRGYLVEHITHVMQANLDAGQIGQPQVPVTLTNFIPPNWIDTLFALKHTTNVMHKMVVPSMYRAIPKETLCASVSDESGKIVATGLGILDRDYIGIYAIHVHPDFRGRHYASSICRAILSKGMKKGATKAYLQVVDGNTPAIRLYCTLGFRYSYSYWFRVKQIGPENAE